MKNLSVALTTYNEEENIEDCLKSIQNLAGEIIIVDGNSKDKTVEIAQKYGANVFKVENVPIFHINKQKAIERCSGNWILQLDADERVDEALASEIQKEINKKENIYNGYWIPRKNFFLGRFLMKGGQYPDYTLRLYRNGKGKLPQKSVHEHAIVEGDVAYLKNPLIHIADKNFSRYKLRFNRYTNLMANELKERKVGYNPVIGIKYLLISPMLWFFLTYFRHKGLLDSWQGFLFSFFSSLRFPISYIKYIKG